MDTYSNYQFMNTGIVTGKTLIPLHKLLVTSMKVSRLIILHIIKDRINN